jgi:hypothetical protein
LAEEYGVDQNSLYRLKNTAIVSFAQDEKTQYVRGWKDGVLVFRDRNFEDKISAGDTWICELNMPSTASCYFAKPILKIDASFMFALKHNEIDEIAEILWDKYKAQLIPQMEEKYKELNKEALDNAVRESENSHRAEIAELKEQLETLKKLDAENQDIISSLESKLTDCKNSKPEVREYEKICDLSDSENIFGTVKVSMDVYRIGADVLKSDFFNKPRYMVHFCPDLKMMFVVPAKHGNVVCMNNTIELAGLNMISQYYEADRKMKSQYSTKYGGLKIFLD